MADTPSPTRGERRRTILLAGGTAIVGALLTFGLAALLLNIYGHKQEARNPYHEVVDLTDTTVDPKVWGQNFPQHYDMYSRTVDQVRTRYGGSEAVPRPRGTRVGADGTTVSQSRLEEDPRLKVMWDGYGFAIDFREERGHAYMLEDQTLTERHQLPQAGTCLHCHASTYVPYKQLGNGDLMAGFEKMNALPYDEARAQMEQVMKGLGEEGLHPVACIDCHDPDTMALRVTRPGFLEGIREVKGADYDVNTQASRQEMRTFVCAQCHVEYYFKGQEKRLVYPWKEGLQADQILDWYEKEGVKDWVHAQTGAEVLKAQHPEFEMWSQGTHAAAGVACADCHMPYQRVGAMKVSDHHVRSPLLNVNNACQTCHKADESELLARVSRIQDRTFEMRNHALEALMDLVAALRASKDAGATDEQLAEARRFQKRAQFLVDFVEAENSMGFHAPQESMRVLGLSIDASRKGMEALRSADAPRGDFEAVRKTYPSPPDVPSPAVPPSGVEGP